MHLNLWRWMGSISKIDCSSVFCWLRYSRLINWRDRVWNSRLWWWWRWLDYMPLNDCTRHDFGSKYTQRTLQEEEEALWCVALGRCVDCSSTESRSIYVFRLQSLMQLNPSPFTWHYNHYPLHVHEDSDTVKLHLENRQEGQNVFYFYFWARISIPLSFLWVLLLPRAHSIISILWLRADISSTPCEYIYNHFIAYYDCNELIVCKSGHCCCWWKMPPS